MQSNQIPARLPIAFATNGARNDIPEESQIGIVPGAASLNDGFPIQTMEDPTDGGMPPDGRDFNGVFYLLSLSIRWMQAGGGFTYDPAFARDPNVSGYPKAAVLQRADYSGFWFNTVDNNQSDPDATDGSAKGWVSMNPDWNAASGPGQILHKPDMTTYATVAVLNADVQSLQQQINGKQPAGDYATNATLNADVSNLQNQINGKQAAGDYATNGALNADVQSLQQQINGKQATGNYVAGADAHGYGLTWTGSRAELSVDGSSQGDIYTSSWYQPMTLYGVGSYTQAVIPCSPGDIVNIGLPGTWRCMGPGLGGGGNDHLFVRIA